MVPKSNDRCPNKKRGHTDTVGRPCKDEGRGWSFAAISQGILRASRS
jgi:hypothetical protein